MAPMQWDKRLISAERAMELAGSWPLYVGIGYADLGQFESDSGGPSQPGQWQVNLRCGMPGCHQSCGLLGVLDVQPGATLIREVRYEATSPEDLLAAVLRHAVTAHEMILSGAGDAAARDSVLRGDRVPDQAVQGGRGGAEDGAAGLPWLR